MKKQLNEVILDNLYHHQLQQSEQFKPVLSLYIQDTVQNCELSVARNCPPAFPFF